MTKKIVLEVNSTLRVMSCDGVVCVRIGEQAFLFNEDDGDSLGATLEETFVDRISPGAREFFGL